MKKPLLILLVFYALARCDLPPDSLHNGDSLTLYPYWTFWVPGATHFYSHRPLAGTLFALAEVGGIAAGIALDGKLKSPAA
jgi:hypothetical protein